MFIFIVYNLLPRAVKVQYCNAYPRYYARSSRYMALKTGKLQMTSRLQCNGDNQYWDNVIFTQSNSHRSHPSMEESHEIPPPISLQSQSRHLSRSRSNATGRSRGSQESYTVSSQDVHSLSSQQHQQNQHHQEFHKNSSPLQPKSLYSNDSAENIHTSNSNNNVNSIFAEPVQQASSRHPDQSVPAVSEVVVSATMQELRDPGLRLIAHGTKSKPRGIWLQLHPTTLIWQTENPSSKKKDKEITSTSFSPQKVIRGKEHTVALVDILYVDVGKHTDALRKIENASLLENVCFSLLTKRGSLDLQAYSVVQRDALVSCFSLVLDEIHAKDWRKIYRAPSSEYPSSIDAPSGLGDHNMRGGLLSDC